jgi:hypothetical protein
LLHNPRLWKIEMGNENQWNYDRNANNNEGVQRWSIVSGLTVPEQENCSTQKKSSVNEKMENVCTQKSGTKEERQCGDQKADWDCHGGLRGYLKTIGKKIENEFKPKPELGCENRDP